jgi:hypothetical protein
MLSTLFRKKKITESQLAMSFVNTTIRSIEDSFEDVIDAIKNDSELASTPSISEKEINQFIFIVFAGNLKLLERFLPASEEISLNGLITEQITVAYNSDYNTIKGLLEEYSSYISRVNHPSKNVLYGMSKAIFFKYNLGKHQEDYFAQLNSPNPIFLKRIDNIMENYLWDWNNFFNKYKITNNLF